MRTVWRITLAVALVSPAVAADADVTAGEQLFQRSCVACHGSGAKGGRAPDLTSGRWRWGSTDSEILKNIVSGIPNTQMPAFPMAAAEGAQIIAYLRSLASPATGTAAAAGTADATAGRDLFFGRGGCSHCHMVAGCGGRLGPNLTAIGANPDLRKSILDPNAALARNFETVEVQLKTGETIRGIKKNEDTISLQMMDEKEHLRMFLKADLKRVEHPRLSLMPIVPLSEAQADNLVAFLKNPADLLPAPGSWTPSADLDVTFARLKNAKAEPQNWLTYWGDYDGTHYSRLNGITPGNAHSLGGAWSYSYGAGGSGRGGPIEATPIVVNGLMFVTGPQNNAAALDARTGRQIWQYTRTLPQQINTQCTVMTNRGVAVLGDRLFMGTLDAHLVSLDAKTGSVMWDIAVESYQRGYNLSGAPLALDGIVIVGATAGECSLPGFVDGYEAASGKRLWRVWTVPQKGDPNRATWPETTEPVGGPTWMTGTYDAATDTLFWTTGNPSPDYDGTRRAGDNLYTCSVLALDPKTGNRKWYFQFTPHDTHDWDANETPVLVDVPVRGTMRKLLIQANRNGFYYVLDRLTGEFLAGKAFSNQNWAAGLDAKGHPIVKPNLDPTPEGTYVCPDADGATNFAAPSFDPKTKFFIVQVREACATYKRGPLKDPVPGVGYTGTGQTLDDLVGAPGAIRALDAATGEIRWNFPTYAGSPSTGVLATAGGVVFGAIADGNLVALNSADGKLVWSQQTGGAIRSSPMSYAVDGRQFVAINSGSTLQVFALRE